MSPSSNTTEPKNDSEYFERMTKMIFNAGLNWKVVDKKWPNFRIAFADFSPTKVSKFNEKNVKALLLDPEIVRNERKIRATIYNAEQFVKLHKEHGSFKNYLDGFNKNNEKDLQKDLQEKFQHLGEATSRMFLWSVKYPLTPNTEEKKWMTAQRTSKPK